MRSSKTLAVLLVLAGGLLAVLAGSRTWLSVTAVTTVHVSGREAAPLGVALGLVVLACALALLTSGRLLRRVVGVLLVACGAGLLVVRFTYDATGDRLVADAVARASGATTGAAGDVYSTASDWPWATAAGGVLVVAGAVVTLVRAGRWQGPSRRYEPAAGPAAAALERDRAFDAWDALSAGADPTDDSPDGPTSRRAVPRRPPHTWQNDDDPGGDP